MTRSIYVCGTDQGAGSSVVALGLYGAFHRTTKKLAFFKPVGDCEENDLDVAVFRTAFGLDGESAAVCPVSILEARDLLANGEMDTLLTRVREAHDRARADGRFVIMEGIHDQRIHDTFDIDIDLHVAAELGAPVLLVARASYDGGPSTIEQLMDNVVTARKAFEARGAEVIGVIVNRAPADRLDDYTQTLTRACEEAALPLFGVVPTLASLGFPKLDQIATELSATVLRGADLLHIPATRTIIAAMQPSNFIGYLDTEHTLVITPGDRDDILLTVASAWRSRRHRAVSGVVLTGGLQPDERIVDLVDEIVGTGIPLLSVAADTFTAATRIRDMNVRIRPQDRDKIDTALSAVDRHVAHERLREHLDMRRRPRRRTGSAAFLEQILEGARASNRCIVLPEGEEPRTLQAADRILSETICPVILLGSPDRIRAAAADLGLGTADRLPIVDPTTSEHVDAYVKDVVESRKDKRGGMTPEVARAWLFDSTIHFATLMVKRGQADGLVSGAIHSTGDTIRPALQMIGVDPEFGVASSVFFMALPDRVLVYGDCAIVPNPNARELAAIAMASARTARAFGIEPRVAMLSYSTGSSGIGRSVHKVAEATTLVKERNPDFVIDGPLQYDAAIDPEVGRLKWPDSPVAGRANVFIFPDLDAGNIAYKAVQRSAGAIAVGPVLQGLSRPVNDLSRGCSVDDIVYTVAATSIQAGSL